MGSIRTVENIAKLAKTSVTTLSLPASRVNIGAAQYITPALTLNTATVGIGGVDATITAGGLYYVYAVLSGNVVYLIASPNSSLPSGFTQARKVGSFNTNGISAIDQVSFIDIYIAPYVPGVSSGLVPSAGLPGRTDGSAVASGYVGEVQQVTAFGVSTAASGTYGDIVSKALTTGRFNVSWGCLFYNNGATSFVEVVVGLGTASGNSGQDLVNGVNSLDICKAAALTSINGNGSIVVDVSATQITILNSSTGTGTARTGNTLYLKALVLSNAGGPATGYGYITAVRIA